MPTNTPDDMLRIGTAERERAIELLGTAFSGGYLQVDEFEERTAEALAALTRGQLRATVRDLPVADQLFPQAQLESTPTGLVAATTSRPLKLKAMWDSTRRRGSWTVPARIFASAEMGSLYLDFRQARFENNVVEVELDSSASSVRLRLGPHHQVNYEQLEVRGWSSVKDKTGPPSGAGGPMIVVVGYLTGMSSLTIRRR